MSVMTLEPRVAGASVGDLDTGFFDDADQVVQHGPQACDQTCFTGMTIACERATSATCTWGNTYLCDS
ncbi:hypothetical protein [Actinomadura gamaensis]|uniref:Uncharacterized protein n=1 Tax=Actinomadura gamaensis TaxID=1763541 RepID=A0ABV9U8V0_9ACTN